MIIYLATWLEDNQGKSLTKVGAKDRLMSYYFMRELHHSGIVTYLITGVLPTKKEQEGSNR